MELRPLDRNGIDPRLIVLATPAPVSHRTAEENLGIGYLASILRQEGYRVKIIDGWLEGMTSEEIVGAICETSLPLFVGVSCYRSNMSRALEISNGIRALGYTIPLVAGGYGPTFHSREFLQAGFDVVVIGEGEISIVELAAHYSTGRSELFSIPGIAFIKNGQITHTPGRAPLIDINALPFPARDTFSSAVMRRSLPHVMTSRGCQAHCTFCSIIAFQRVSGSHQWRQRSICNIVDELEQLANMGATHVKVIDDSLIEPPRAEDWAREFAEEIEKRGVNLLLRGQIRADRVSDELVGALKRAGFYSYSCGIENFSPSALHRMSKTATLEQNLNALDIFQRHDIIVQAGHILFDYGTTMQELEDNYYYFNKYIWTISRGIFSEMYAANGTPYTTLLSKRQALIGDPLGLGNNSYAIEDESARRVYMALKTWHRSHLKIYDMGIDPVSAPKAISLEDSRFFWQLSIDMKKSDITFFRKILDLVDEGISDSLLSSFVNEQIEQHRPFYRQMRSKIIRAYHRIGMFYDADLNPFVC